MLGQRYSESPFVFRDLFLPSVIYTWCVQYVSVRIWCRKGI